MRQIRILKSLFINTLNKIVAHLTAMWQKYIHLNGCLWVKAPIKYWLMKLFVLYWELLVLSQNIKDIRVWFILSARRISYCIRQIQPQVVMENCWIKKDVYRGLFYTVQTSVWYVFLIVLASSKYGEYFKLHWATRWPVNYRDNLFFNKCQCSHFKCLRF